MKPRIPGACLGILVTAATLLSPACAADLRVSTDDNSATIASGDKTLLHYRLKEVPRKPYADQLFTPGGVNILRDAPHDHLHHHGLMFAVKIDGVDFWAENAKCGQQVVRSVEGGKSSAGKDASACFTHVIDWKDAAGAKTLAVERRTVGIWKPEDMPATVVTWTTRLQPPEGVDAITLSGSHYFGLGMRFIESMDKVGRFFNPEGKQGEVVRGQERLVRAKWCAYTAPAGGKPVTAAMLDHPKNPRHPARFFTMPAHFAYLSATLNYWKEPLVVKAGEPLVLNYAVAVWDGEVKAEEVEKLYQRWAER